MLMMAEEVPPGAPTVDRAGPALPALLMKMALCLLTTCTRRHAKHHQGRQACLACPERNCMACLQSRLPAEDCRRPTEGGP